MSEKELKFVNNTMYVDKDVYLKQKFMLTIRLFLTSNPCSRLLYVCM